MTLGHREAIAERDQLKAELARALERIAELEAQHNRPGQRQAA